MDQDPGTFKVPIHPPNLVADGKISLKLEGKDPGAPSRPPRPGEVEIMGPIYLRACRRLTTAMTEKA